MKNKNKLINHFKVLGTQEEKNLQAWIENQIGTRKAKVFTKKGFENYVVIFENIKKWKTNQQNKTFWALIDCFYKSSCSSFWSYEEMVEHYYRIAGLITIKTKNCLKQETKLLLYNAIKKLHLTYKTEQNIYKMLKGEYEKHLSWSRVGKKKAILTIDSLLHDMDESNVIGSKMGKKYEEILIGMEKL